MCVCSVVCAEKCGCSQYLDFEEPKQGKKRCRFGASLLEQLVFMWCMFVVFVCCICSVLYCF